VAQWRPPGAGGFGPWALHVLEIEDGRIRLISSFLDERNGLFARLGLPQTPPAESDR